MYGLTGLVDVHFFSVLRFRYRRQFRVCIAVAYWLLWSVFSCILPIRRVSIAAISTLILQYCWYFCTEVVQMSLQAVTKGNCVSSFTWEQLIVEGYIWCFYRLHLSGFSLRQSGSDFRLNLSGFPSNEFNLPVCFVVRTLEIIWNSLVCEVLS